MNNSVGNFSRSSSTRSRRTNINLPKSSYSSPTPGSAPRSPSYQCTVVEPPPIEKSPTFVRSPNRKSPKVHLSSPNNHTDGRVFDFNSASTSSTYDQGHQGDILVKQQQPNDNVNDHFNLQSPPKPKISKMSYHRQHQYQSSKSDSSNSKSSLEYQSTTKHQAYQDIEYKICHSLDSSETNSSTYASSRHSSFKQKKKPQCNIRTNPGYDDRYGSMKSIDSSTITNEHKRSYSTMRCRKSTSDLTDLTDEMANTTMTSLSRPSSPRRKGSVKGGLAYLASRRGSRDSVASNVSNEDIGPLNFQNTARGRQRRTSNFLELPGNYFIVIILMAFFIKFQMYYCKIKGFPSNMIMFTSFLYRVFRFYIWEYKYLFTK